MEEDWRERVKATPVSRLRELFPGEAQSHRSMMSRVRDGKAFVHNDLKSLKSFLLVLGPRPKPSWTLDRLDPTDPEYAPNKVRWADKRQQANNRTNTIFLTVGGEMRALADWARLTNQKPNTLRQRLKRGLTHEEVVRGRKRGGPRIGEAAIEAEFVDASLWPGLTARFWEKHYRRAEFALKQQGYPSITRKQFAFWVCDSVSAGLRRALAESYQEFRADYVDESEFDHNSQLQNDVRYSTFLAFDRARQSILPAMAFGDRDQLRWLRQLGCPLHQEDGADIIVKAMEKVKEDREEEKWAAKRQRCW